MNTHHHEHHGHSDSKGKFEVKITSEPSVIEAGNPTNLSISITESGKNVPLEMVHEMKMHLLIVNEELTWFDHIHPEEQADGSYKVSETFPLAGKYLLFSDYKPNGAEGEVNKQTIEVKGTAAAQTTELKTKLVSPVDGFTVTLLNGEDFKTKRNQRLQFSVEKDGKHLEEKDMQNYLGVTAHIVMISKADKDFLHIHPVSKENFPIYAETHIEKAGLYRMWVQFKLNDVVHTADFTVTVVEGEKSANDHSSHHHHH
ncbi:hypothetical protein [Sphingobacterium cellulitidis]|uniref:hypothetical protein n=1 Tax=Sphingobacterium cellulitidis TaxID=1768011 RepID=UPI000B944D39|nr:hypothetical protein CHT99_07640 [Sphingobacterium cellulitidis]